MLYNNCSPVGIASMGYNKQHQKNPFLRRKKKMALTNTKVTGTQGTPGATATAAKGKKTEANEVILAQGNEILASMSEEARAALGSKSNTLHFVRLLGLASKKSSRRISADVSKDCSTPVGITLVSDEAIQVPVIDVLKNKDTGIEYGTDVAYIEVPAGQEFDVTYYEFMYLILRDEYAGFCSHDGDARGVYFSPKLPAFWKGEAKLPTPTVNLKVGSVKASMIDIDEKGTNGWVIKPNYADKFGPLMKKSTPQRAQGAKSATPAPTVVAMALQKILFKK
jgi:hypothetical protein